VITCAAIQKARSEQDSLFKENVKMIQTKVLCSLYKGIAQMMADIFCIPFSVLVVSQTSEHKAISLVVSAYILIVTLIEMQDISLFILCSQGVVL
jgi:hypothetical protein